MFTLDSLNSQFMLYFKLERRETDVLAMGHRIFAAKLNMPIKFRTDEWELLDWKIKCQEMMTLEREDSWI